MQHLDTYACYGYAMELLSVSEYHQHFQLGPYIYREIVPALLCGQIKFYIKDCGTPIGMVTWAWLKACVEADVHKTGRSLLTAEWTAGNRLYFNDFVAPYGATRKMLRDLMKNIFPNHQASSIDRNNDGSIRKIKKWTGVAYRK